ncbi:WhiB family transcriptional regulator [Ilumatobacter sp.]|uniref:WhiB family transcriptional regulator n=1 Tax=Ilumatobacter sp. TaxID=1967498 RepID=UPI003B5185BE
MLTTLIESERRSEADPADADDLSWREDAACKGETRLFFAPKAERPQARARRETKAQRLCDECPVARPCRAFARDHREYGYWAGESEEDRHLAGFTVSAPIGIRARHHKPAS